jgi:hypothetical protein
LRGLCIRRTSELSPKASTHGPSFSVSVQDRARFVAATKVVARSLRWTKVANVPLTQQIHWLSPLQQGSISGGIKINFELTVRK